MRISHYLSFIQAELFSLPIIGLDISDASFHVVKAAQQPSGMYSINYALKGEIPPGIIELGEIKREKDLSELLRKQLLKLKHSRPHDLIVASLPEEKAFIKTLEIPLIEDPEEMRNAIRFEAETNIPIPASEMYFDYEDTTPPSKKPYGHRDIVVIAYPKSLVDSYVQTITDAGFGIAALELESQSIIRSLIGNDTLNEPVLIIDIGRTKAGFSIFANHTITFTSTLPIGGRDFEKSLQDTLGLTPSAAERLKKERGLARDDEKIMSALQPMVSVIADEAKKNLEFYETYPRHAHSFHQPIQRMVLCGGDAHLLGLMEELTARTGLSVEYGKPLRAFVVSPRMRGDLTEHDALSFTTALGLAMRS